MTFEFATANRILFGAGTLKEAAPAAASMGRRVLTVISSGANGEALCQAIEQQRLACATLAVAGEPTVDSVLEGVTRAREFGADVVIGLGGGSAIDTAKAIAALLTNGGHPLDYLEVIGKGKPLSRPAAPLIAIPTTAGTGAEVTRNAVLGSPEHHVKVSLRSPYLLPRLALVDPELTYSVPPGVTAASGLDALTQVIEPYTSNSANPLTDALCAEGIRRAGRSLLRAYRDGGDKAAREDMSLAALFGGLALANSKLGAVHGFAGVLGGVLPAAHGAICARLLPLVMEANIQALQARDPASPALGRYDDVARYLTGRPTATALDGVEFVKRLCADLKVRSLGDFGFQDAMIATVVPQARVASSMKGNVIALTDEELERILRQAR